MKLANILFKPAMVTAALALATSPAFAQRDHSRSNEGHAVQRSAPRRAESPRGESHAPARAMAPRVESRGAARAESRVVVPRVESREGPRVVGPRGGVAVPRSAIVGPRGGVVVPHGYAPRVYAPRAYAPRHDYGYRYGYRPYVFRPWHQLSFGLSLGYSVPYAYSFAYPVPVYGYGAPSAPVYVGPTSALYGGVTLEMTPGEATVVVDGQAVGTVADFDGTTAPLNLTAGRHHIEISAAGYAPLAFDVTVTPGQLVPYRGDLQPIQ